MSPFSTTVNNYIPKAAFANPSLAAFILLQEKIAAEISGADWRGWLAVYLYLRLLTTRQTIRALGLDDLVTELKPSITEVYIAI